MWGSEPDYVWNHPSVYEQQVDFVSYTLTHQQDGYSRKFKTHLSYEVVEPPDYGDTSGGSQTDGGELESGDGPGGLVGEFDSPYFNPVSENTVEFDYASGQRNEPTVHWQNRG